MTITYDNGQIVWNGTVTYSYNSTAPSGTFTLYSDSAGTLGGLSANTLQAKTWLPGDSAVTYPNYYDPSLQETYGQNLANHVLWTKEHKLPKAFPMLDARGRHAFITTLVASINKMLIHPSKTPKKLTAARAVLALAHERLVA